MGGRRSEASSSNYSSSIIGSMTTFDLDLDKDIDLSENIFDDLLQDLEFEDFGDFGHFEGALPLPPVPCADPYPSQWLGRRT